MCLYMSYLDNDTINKKIIKTYSGSSKGIRSVARILGLSKTYVGKVVNNYQKNGKIPYNNYISPNMYHNISWR